MCKVPRRNHERVRKLKGGRSSTERKEEREGEEVRTHIMKVQRGPGLYFDGQERRPGGKIWGGALQRDTSSGLGRLEGKAPSSEPGSFLLDPL